MHSGHRTRFLCDSNLGRLAKWLRILGFDTLYMKNMKVDIMEEERAAGRVILTRSSGLSLRKGYSLIRSDFVTEQIKEVDEQFIIIGQSRPFSRCAVCNEPLLPADRSLAGGHVPEYTLRTAVSFMRCPVCDRFYWQGSHTERACETIQNIMEYMK